MVQRCRGLASSAVGLEFWNALQRQTSGSLPYTVERHSRATDDIQVGRDRKCDRQRHGTGNVRQILSATSSAGYATKSFFNRKWTMSANQSVITPQTRTARRAPSWASLEYHNLAGWLFALPWT